MAEGLNRQPHPTSDADSGSLIEAVRCPHCAAGIDLHAATIVCSGCGQVYPRLGAIPVLLAEPPKYLAACRRQLALLEQQADHTVEKIEEQLRMADVLSVTRTRCRAIIEGVQGQLAAVRAIVGPCLPASASGAREDAPLEEVPATIEYLPYLFRDWGSPEPDGENERALAAVEAVLERQQLGRTLVLGAGACRLAYDLHKRDPDADMVVIDIDPVLFAAAHVVTRGGTLSIEEANWELCEIGHSSREWVLTAPDGPIDDERFHFLLADGLEPPFATGMVDTVVTPWFIDQAPADVRDLISTLHRLLKPGGRWLNLGPLRYDRNVPVVLRFSREELFDLAARSGFRLDRWQTDSVPYLVSKLNGRGKVEWVLAFAATKLDAPADSQSPDDGPPPWLIFTHLPIPAFAGQSMFWSKAPAIQMVVSAIDGRRTLDDIALLVARHAPQSELSISQIRAAVRQCLAEVHPACRKEW